MRSSQEFTCLNCSKLFKPIYYINQTKIMLYCSTKCHYERKRQIKDSSSIVCNKCNELKSIDNFEKFTNSSRCRKTCQTCRKAYKQKFEKNFQNTNGVGSRNLFRGESVENFLKGSISFAKKRAKNIGREFNLDFPYIFELFKEQQGLCKLTNRLMTWDVNKKRVITNISIDRIDSSKGYIKGNVQLCCYFSNIMKNNLDMENLIAWCQDIITTNKGIIQQ